jgi:hypothetical protein
MIHLASLEAVDIAVIARDEEGQDLPPTVSPLFEAAGESLQDEESAGGLLTFRIEGGACIDPFGEIGDLLQHCSLDIGQSGKAIELSDYRIERLRVIWHVQLCGHRTSL